MPRQQVKKTYFNFVGGLNTEAGYLTFPQNVWKDGDNVIPQLDGSLHLRTAINYEDNFALSAQVDSTLAKDTLAFGCHEWNSAKGDGNLNYIVVQRGRFLHFYKNVGGTTATSSTEKVPAFIIDLNAYKAPLYPGIIGTDPIQCVSANGRLVVTSIATDPILIEELDGATSFTVTRLTLRFRDFEGHIGDENLGNDIDKEPSTLSNPHKYNLFNQGWRGVHVDSYFASQAVYPSNAQQWFLGKDATDTFSAPLLVKQEFGKSRAPQGHFLLEAFDRDRTDVSGVTGIAVEEEKFRPSACEFFAGRVWYAGTPNSAKISGWVMFSQVALSNEKYALCYQEADPTSEHISDLVDSDGGVIPIHGVGTINRLVAADRYLLVFADNGVWAISGTLDAGFSATAYEVRQISAVAAVGPQAVVRVEDHVMYWSKEGIWLIRPTKEGGLAITSGSDKSIATFYRNIPALAKDHAVGVYHAEDKKVYWLYQAAPNSDGVTRRFLKDRMLVLDTRIGAFYTHTIQNLASNTPKVIDAIVTRGSGTASFFKLMTQSPSGSDWSITWSEFEDGTNQVATFKDWYAANNAGMGYVGFILTGYDLGVNQGGDRKLQTNYITVLMKRTETGIDAAGEPINGSSVKLTARWHFTDDAIAHKWSTTQELYRHRRVFIPSSLPSSTYVDGYPVLVVKHKLRGRGNAFQLKFESTIGKDFKLIGWSIPVLSNVD